MAWNASEEDIVGVRYVDETGQGKESKVRVDSGTSEATIQTLISRFQEESNASIQSYTRHKVYTNDAAPAPVAFDPEVNPLNALSNALDLEFSCGPAVQHTSTSILAPSNTDLILGSFDKLRLDPDSTGFTNIQSAAIACMVNTGGDPVVTLEKTQVETRKSRMLL